MEIRNQKDLGDNVARVIADQGGYYLLGFELPGSDTSRRQTVAGGVVIVRLRKKSKEGLQVRFRRGVLGEDAPPPRHGTPREQLLAALVSPFASEMDVRLTALFGQDENRGAVIRGLMHVGGDDLTLAEANGVHEAKYNVMAMAFSDKGAAEGVENRDGTVRVADIAAFRRSGHFLTFSIPARKPGAYQVRVAVRDSVSGRMGSAHQIVRVPDLSKKRLAMSGIVLGTAGAGESDSSSALRRFTTGASLSYLYAVYNPRVQPGAGGANLDMELRLTRDDTLVFSAPAAVEAVPLDVVEAAGHRTDLPAFMFTGAFRLSDELPPGTYALQISTTDRARRPDDENRIATQWTDFEVTERKGAR
jgi:hypothetical protein